MNFVPLSYLFNVYNGQWAVPEKNQTEQGVEDMGFPGVTKK